MKGTRLALVLAGMCLCGLAWAEAVDFTKPLETDKDTMLLFNLDDVASGTVKDAASEKTGKVVEAKEAEGKFGKALACDGSKSWVDIEGLPKADLTTLTVECWLNLKAGGSGDAVCRNGLYMIRLSGARVQAYFWVDGGWKTLTGNRTIAAGKWTHVAIEWDGAAKKSSIYVNGNLDVSAVPENVTDGKLNGSGSQMRIGNHTWGTGPAAVVNGLIDEVRVSSALREYKPIPGTEKDETVAAAPKPTAGGGGGAARPAAPAGPSVYKYVCEATKDDSDAPKSQTVEITEGKKEYKVAQGGTMDGRSCRGPMSCGISMEGAFIQTWESNKSLRMENAGETDVVNPWISNGHNNFRNVNEIVASAITPEMSEGEKAFAIWFQEIQHRHHSPSDSSEVGDPVKVYNVYGYNTCGNDTNCLGILFKAAGIAKVAPARASGHCIPQAWFDNAWHFFDGDMHAVYLLRDNVTVASDIDISRDHDLIRRTHSKGILTPEVDWLERGQAGMYFTESEITGDRGRECATNMNMTLRPGEALEWRWGAWSPLKYHGFLQTSPQYRNVQYSGIWEYRPDFAKETWRKAATVDGVVSTPEGLKGEEGKTGTIVWKMSTPYVYCGGKVESEGAGAKFSVSVDGGKSWDGSQSMDKIFDVVKPARYQYQLKCELAPGATLKKVDIVNDVQMAPMAMPEIGVGENTLTYTDETQGARKVQITHNWVERSATKPPTAPAEAVNPADGSETSGTDIVFKWAAATDPDGDAIMDYQFEVSRRADMRVPVSMSFYKLLHGPTPKWGPPGPQYALQWAGLLTPGTKYYWHVRAMDAKGVWGPWSKTWSFTAQGPSYPLEVKLDFEEATGKGTLHWKANPVGRAPVKYRVYGCDEKGFTASDKGYKLGGGAKQAEVKVPASFIGEVTGTEMVVMGPEVTSPAGNTDYYRVVAVDDQGKRSGPSDYVTAPRPVIFSKPVLAAKAGEEYKYQVSANRSMGNIYGRVWELGGVSSGMETPKFVLAKGPAWLKMDEATGLLSGTPDAAGKFKVEVTVTIDRKIQKFDEAKLAWGIDSVVGEEDKRVGQATQKFVIEAQ